MKIVRSENKIVQIQINYYSWLYLVKSYHGRPEKDSFVRNWDSDSQTANEERTSHSFNENQPMHRKRNFLKIFLQPNLTKITQCLYLTPFLISLKEVSFNFEWNGRNFNKLIKSSVKTEGWIVFNLSSHYTCVGFYDPHETLWKGSMWPFQQGKTCS